MNRLDIQNSNFENNKPVCNINSKNECGNVALVQKTDKKSSHSFGKRVIQGVGFTTGATDIAESVHNFRNNDHKKGSLRLLKGLIKISILSMGALLIKGGLHTNVIQRREIENRINMVKFTHTSCDDQNFSYLNCINGNTTTTVDAGLGIHSEFIENTFIPGWLSKAFGAQLYVQKTSNMWPLFASEAFELTEHPVCGTATLINGKTEGLCVSLSTHAPINGYKEDQDYWKNIIEMNS